MLLRRLIATPPRALPRPRLLQPPRRPPRCPARLASSVPAAPSAIATGALDHICICVDDIQSSIAWYNAVLGFELQHATAENFFPVTSGSPAFLRSPGGAQVALLPLPPTTSPIADHQVRVSIDSREFLPGFSATYR